MSEQATTSGIVEDFEFVKQRSLWLDALERLIRNKAAMIGLAIATLVVFTAVMGPTLAPYDYLDQNLIRINERPTLDHWFGTDGLGRDMLSRIMWGARTAVFVAIVVLVISTFLGVSLGSIAAYAGGWVDDLIMRVTDVTLSFPDLLLAAFLSVAVRNPVIEFVANLHARTGWAILEQTIFLDYLVMFGALAAVGWAGKARLIRGQILSLREQDFIRAEEALGVPAPMILRKHLIPNSIAPIIVSMTIQVGSTMLSESSLSFLGLGIQPPGASWGNMVSENLVYWTRDPHLVYVPGLVLATAVFGFNFLGDGLNDAFNPRMIRR